MTKGFHWIARRLVKTNVVLMNDKAAVSTILSDDLQNGGLVARAAIEDLAKQLLLEPEPKRLQKQLCYDSARVNQLYEQNPTKPKMMLQAEAQVSMNAITAAIHCGKNAGKSALAIFPKFTFLNHSCNPNAQNLHSEDGMSLTVRALRDIPKGCFIIFLC